MGLGSTPLEWPRKVWNIDNTENKAGSITHSITLDMQTNGQWNDMTFLITNLGKEELLLGYPWLVTYEPWISWRLAVPFGDTLPIIIRSRRGEAGTREDKPMISAQRIHIDTPMSEEKQAIFDKLQEEHQIQSLSTDLAI